MARGGKWRGGWKCGCCGYAPKEKEWRAALAAFEKKTDEEQTEERKEHNEVGVAISKHSKHFHQQKYMPPGVILDMMYAGANNLHLIFLNIFKHLFKLTVHDGLPGVHTSTHTIPRALRPRLEARCCGLVGGGWNSDLTPPFAHPTRR